MMRLSPIPPHPLMQQPPTDLNRHAEASRYALLRRLAPAMRHQMAGSFQPVSMKAAIIEKRLLAAAPDLPALAKTSSDVRAMALAATRSSLDLMRWIAVDADARVPLDKGIEEALHLVATELSFRGITCVNQTGGVSTEVALHHVRGVLVAALLALADAAATPADLRLAAMHDGDAVQVTVTLTDATTTAEHAPGDEFALSLASYRQIDWDDVAAMAAADGVSVEHTPVRVVLRLPVSTV